jgi:hypothetical protein
MIRSETERRAGVGYSTKVECVLLDKFARRQTPQHSMHGREAVAPPDTALHTVCCPRFSAVQAAQVPAGSLTA